MKHVMLVLVAAVIFVMAGCDEAKESNHKKYEILETVVYTPSKLTVDVELLQTQGIVLFVTVLEGFEVTDIGYKLYDEDQDWRVKDELSKNPKYPHQISQFLFMYDGYVIDTRKTITLIRVGISS